MLSKKKIPESQGKQTLCHLCCIGAMGGCCLCPIFSCMNIEDQRLLFIITGCWTCYFQFNPFRTAVSFWGQLGTNDLEFEWCVPQNGTGVLKGLKYSINCGMSQHLQWKQENCNVKCSEMANHPRPAHPSDTSHPQPGDLSRNVRMRPTASDRNSCTVYIKPTADAATTVYVCQYKQYTLYGRGGKS